MMIEAGPRASLLLLTVATDRLSPSFGISPNPTGERHFVKFISIALELYIASPVRLQAENWIDSELLRSTSCI
jgi:hypothetical protein